MSNNPFEAPGAMPPQFQNEPQSPTTKVGIPGLALTFAILGFCVGAWSLLGGCCGAGGMVFQSALVDFVEQSDKEAGKLMKKQMEVQGKFMVFNVFQLIVSIVMGGLIIFAAYSVCTKAPFGLGLLSNTYLIFAVLTLITIVLSIYVHTQLAGEMQEILKDMPRNVRDQNETSQSIGLIIGIVISGVFLILYVVGGVMLRGEKVRDRYRQCVGR